MVIKLYISGISGNKEVKKKQQRVQMILDSKQINYEAIDITEPGKEKDKEFMQQNGKVRENLGKYPLPPQIFNDDDFCGDYEDFDMANEVDELEKFLHIEASSKDLDNGSKQDKKSRCMNEEFLAKNNNSTNDSLYNPYEYHTFTVKYDSVNGLKEEIISSNNLIEEKDQIEETVKSEVNGESETVPTVELSSDEKIENVETSADEVLVPEKEESTAKETTAEEETGEMTVENEPEVETKEREDENENVESSKGEEAENPETTPLPKDDEEEEPVDDMQSVEKVADENKEESERDSSESEKSQEE